MAATHSVEPTPELLAYAAAGSTAVHPSYHAIRADTEARTGDRALMQISELQMGLLSMLVRLVGARFAVEVGTFTGSSGLAIASALPEGGRLLCCDVSEEWTSIARRHWAEAGVDDRIDLVLAPATETLAALPADPPIDFAFVDADKGGYVDYYEAIVPRLRPGGLLAVDNVLWSGAVVDDSRQDPDTVAIRRFNAHAAADDRCDVVVLPMADGITLCRKR